MQCLHHLHRTKFHLVWDANCVFIKSHKMKSSIFSPPPPCVGSLLSCHFVLLQYSRGGKSPWSYVVKWLGLLPSAQYLPPAFSTPRQLLSFTFPLVHNCLTTSFLLLWKWLLLPHWLQPSGWGHKGGWDKASSWIRLFLKKFHFRLHSICRQWLLIWK